MPAMHLADQITALDAVSMTTLAPPPTAEPEPAPVLTGGLLGERTVYERSDGTWVINTPVFEGARDREGVWRRYCIPLLFLQERMHVDREGKRDFYIKEKQIRLDEECALLRLGHVFSHHAHSQLASLTGVPVSYFHRLISFGRRALAARCINAGIVDRKHMERYDEDGRFLVRLKHNTIRGLQTDTYGIYDNFQVLDDLVKILPQEMLPEIMCSQIWTDGNDIKFSFLFPDRWTQEPEGVAGIGCLVGNSEVGRLSVYVKPYIYIGETDTGISYDRADPELAIIEARHVGRKIEMRDRVRAKMRANVVSLLSSSQLLLAQLRACKNVNVVNPGAVLTYLCRRENLTQEMGRDWFAHLPRVPEGSALTAYQLVLALTVAAREKGADVRGDLEAAAGRMLVPSLTVKPDRLQATWMAYMAAGQKLEQRLPKLVEAHTTGVEVPLVQAELPSA